jgi:DNA-directed RNA polymerase subunit RPC12/RpoP
MAKDYEIQKGSGEEPCVVYRCSQCGHQIESLLSDAGSRDNCPACSKAVTVPGEAEWQLLQKAEREAAARQDSAGESTVGWIAHTAVEAQVAIAALEEAGIPHLAEDFLNNPYDGAFATQFGWGRILVREDDVQRAKEVIQEALEPCPLADAEEEPEGDEETETDTPSAP